MICGMTKVAAESVKEDFSEAQFFEARAKVWAMIDALASEMRPGLRESEAKEICKKMFRDEGISQAWHATQIRFGQHTLKSFGEATDIDAILGENDIFFLDLGVVWNGYEGDAGRTFVVGKNPDYEKCRDDVRRIFDEVAAHWSRDKVNGIELYDFAVERAKAYGWVLNLDLNGHRLGDFPHALVHKGSLMDFNETPSPNRWVLEIQIRHPTESYGAFYEDLLSNN